MHTHHHQHQRIHSRPLAKALTIVAVLLFMVGGFTGSFLSPVRQMPQILVQGGEEGFELKAKVNPVNDKDPNTKCNVDIDFVPIAGAGGPGCDGSITLTHPKGTAGPNGWNNRGGTYPYPYPPKYTGSPYTPGETVTFTGKIGYAPRPNCVDKTSSVTVKIPPQCGATIADPAKKQVTCDASANCLSKTDGQEEFCIRRCNPNKPGFKADWYCKNDGTGKPQSVYKNDIEEKKGCGATDNPPPPSGDCDDSCTQCIMTQRPDLLKQYEKDNPKLAACHKNMINDWCSRTVNAVNGQPDSSKQECDALKAGTCKDACAPGGNTGGNTGGTTVNGCLELSAEFPNVSGTSQCNGSLKIVSLKKEKTRLGVKMEKNGGSPEVVILDQDFAFDTSPSTTITNKIQTFTAGDKVKYNATITDSASACKGKTESITVTVPAGCAGASIGDPGKTEADAIPAACNVSTDKHDYVCLSAQDCQREFRGEPIGRLVGDESKMGCSFPKPYCCELRYSTKNAAVPECKKLTWNDATGETDVAKAGYYFDATKEEKGDCYSCHGRLQINLDNTVEYGKVISGSAKDILCRSAAAACSDGGKAKSGVQTDGSKTYECYGLKKGMSWGKKISDTVTTETYDCSNVNLLEWSINSLASMFGSDSHVGCTRAPSMQIQPQVDTQQQSSANDEEARKSCLNTLAELKKNGAACELRLHLDIRGQAAKNITSYPVFSGYVLDRGTTRTLWENAIIRKTAIVVFPDIYPAGKVDISANLDTSAVGTVCEPVHRTPWRIEIPVADVEKCDGKYYPKI